MTFILVAINSLACLAIFWVCGTFLLVRDGATSMKQMTAQLGLLLAMVGAFASGLAPLMYQHAPAWWTLLLRVGIALIALTRYDNAFGIAQQVRNTVHSLAELPSRAAAWWHERLAIAYRNARLRR